MKNRPDAYFGSVFAKSGSISCEMACEMDRWIMPLILGFSFNIKWLGDKDSNLDPRSQSPTKSFDFKRFSCERFSIGTILTLSAARAL
jgi:hypothetical protein